MKTKFLVVAIITLFAGISDAGAQAKRAHHQRQRINQGVRSGELTKAEARNLRNDQKEIRQDVKLAKADGKATKAERKIIRKERKKESREIFRKKHNNRDRG